MKRWTGSRLARVISFRWVNNYGSCDYQVTRPGEESVKCTLILALDHQPSQYKLSSKLGKLLGIHTASKVDIVNGIWQYIKVKLCDGYVM